MKILYPHQEATRDKSEELLRFAIKHFFHFGKQRLNLADCQTPEVAREEHWWQLAHIAYAQLWMARHVADALPRPWERNLPVMQKRLISPTLVQRDFARIIPSWGLRLNRPNAELFRQDGPEA